jgi:hypothetical protein
LCHLSLHFLESKKKKNTIQDIVHESSKAIWKVLQPIYMAVPTSDEWLQIADEFNYICKMPNCKGSIVGKHCCIKCPSNNGSLYFNYNSFHSINLLGMADANCCFTLIDVGALGHPTDQYHYYRYRQNCLKNYF